MGLPAVKEHPSGTVLDASGQPFKLGAVAHQAASRHMPGLQNWFPRGGSADADLLPELDIMRRRSRDSLRNHPILAGAEQTNVDHIVGSGLRPVPKPNYRALGRDRKWAREWHDRVVSLYDPYAKSKAIDASAIQTGRGIEGILVRSALGNGDACMLPRWKPNRPGTKWATCFLVIEADRLSNPHGEPDSERLRGGVEIDADGAPIAYHVSKGHPGDSYLGGGLWSNFFDRRRKTGPGGIYTTGSLATGQWIRIPAKTAWGRPRFIHAFDQHRPGQHRGKPIYSAVLPMFKYMDKLMQVEMQSAIVNALIALFVETPLGPEGLEELFGDQTDAATTVLDAYEAYRTKQQRAALQTGPGMYSLYPGEKVTAHSANRPAGSFPPVMEALYGLIGAGLSMPPQHLLKDFRKANFASARMAVAEAYKFYMGRRDWLVDCALQPVYECWLEEAVSKGEVDAPDFWENREYYVCADWIGEGPPPVEPKKDAEAVEIRRRSGQSTYTQELAAKGIRVHEHIEALADENELLAEAKLGHLATGGATAQAETQPSEEDEPYTDGSDGGDKDLEGEE
jgi:capsid protein